jgi:hypothetical protein
MGYFAVTTHCVSHESMFRVSRILHGRLVSACLEMQNIHFDRHPRFMLSLTAAIENAEPFKRTLRTVHRVLRSAATTLTSAVLQQYSAVENLALRESRGRQYRWQQVP